MMNASAEQIVLRDPTGAERVWPVGVRVAEALGAAPAGALPFVAALHNHEAVGLGDRIEVGGTLVGLTAGDPHGARVVQRSMSFLLAMAVHRCAPEAAFRVHHSVGSGLFCTLDEDPETPGEPVSATRLADLSQTLRSLVGACLPIRAVLVGYVEAMGLFEAGRQQDKINLLRHRNSPGVRLLECDGYLDLQQGPLVPETGLLGLFELIPHASGFVMHLPSPEQPGRLPDFAPHPHLIRIYQEHRQWGQLLGVRTVGQLNERVHQRRIHDVILMAEALHNKKLACIADEIAARRPRAQVVLIAGPSSAGKTTSSKRLCTHLQVNGLRPTLLAADDYFVGDERNPRDASGQPDYEHIEALDLEALNEDLDALLHGRSIRRRTFDFRAKSPVLHDETLALGADGVLVIEGLHGLNPRLTGQVPRERKFLVYLSALTQLGLDDSNRISTTDNRLIRRLVRDHRFRGHSPLRTMRLWPSVRRGEERWIFPFQHLADATFNSSLDYELAVLKPLVEPLLTEIKPDVAEYTDARRLMGFLANFYAITADAVPGDSILREYIGDSQLQY